MLNPAEPFNSGSYGELRERVLKQMRSAHIDDHIFELIQAACNSALSDQGLVLSAAEQRRLLADVMKSVLDDMQRRLDQG